MSNGYFWGRAFQKNDSKTLRCVFEKQQGKGHPLEKSECRWRIFGYQSVVEAHPDHLTPVADWKELGFLVSEMGSHWGILNNGVT